MGRVIKRQPFRDALARLPSRAYGKSDMKNSSGYIALWYILTATIMCSLK